MSYSTWHNYGYGIRVDDIKEQSVERLQALLKLAPELDQKIRAWLSELDIAEPDWDDYMDFDQVYYLALPRFYSRSLRSGRPTSDCL